MVEGKHKSRNYRRIFVRTPNSKTKIQYRRRKVSKAKCAECGAELKGILRERDYKMQNAAKSSKRPERPFGGYLCSKCSRKKIITEARSK